MPAAFVFTPEVLAKLKMAFLIGATDEEACCFADISVNTFYDYQARTEGYAQEKAKWKQTPILKARQSLINGLTDPELALKYLERKKKDEFSLRQEYVGKDNGPIEHNVQTNISLDKQLSDLIDDFQKLKEYKANGEHTAPPGENQPVQSEPSKG